ncbi:MAG: ABC transporter substrate-binding protein [Tannerellaceae bacterium]|jgi:NitT/TauT family transport system substrate-binding protein|nr:ABC transporter substrate-binding protein [Tannerellaceae bacterium]
MKYLIPITLCLCLLACRGAEKQADEWKAVVLRGPSALAFAQWMKEQPEVDGRKITVRIADSPDQVAAALVKEEADLAVLPMINAANLYNKGVPYRLAGCPIWGNLYIVGRENARRLHVFGRGATPNILSRYYLDHHKLPYVPVYTLETASEVVRGILGGKVEAAVLPEPFVSMVLERDSTFRLLSNLNTSARGARGFAETAILLHNSLGDKAEVFDQLIKETCRFAAQHPDSVIPIMEQRAVFPPGMLTAGAIKRSNILYIPADEAEKEIRSFLEIIYRYEPQAIGGKMPAAGFFRNDAHRLGKRGASFGETMRVVWVNDAHRFSHPRAHSPQKAPNRL